MNDTGNIEKRIKRHVLGKPQDFYVSTLPGIERLCYEELARLGFSLPDTRPCKGGIEFAGRVHDCYLANLNLRTANRILMRLTAFYASNFRQLEKKLADLPWDLYLKNNSEFTLNITSRHSRLIHTGAIGERFTASLEKRINARPEGSEKSQVPDTGKSQQIFVRAENDLFTVSIDTSGELLHKRGLKIQGGKAPVRETIAAAILCLAGYQPGEPLIDPMCGTGTFSLEAAMIANNIPAGWYRPFAFMDWPSFRPSRWKHIRREAKKKITPVAGPVIFASDIDPENSRKLEQVVSKNNLATTINVFSSDFFDLRPRNIIRELQGFCPEKHQGLIVLNPPYGRRLGAGKRIDKLFEQICKKLQHDFKGWKAAILVPDKHLVKTIPFKATVHDFFHGGLKITLITGKIL